MSGHYWGSGYWMPDELISELQERKKMKDKEKEQSKVMATVSDMSRLYGVSRTTIRGYAERGKIPNEKKSKLIMTKSYFFELDEMEEWNKKQELFKKRVSTNTIRSLKREKLKTMAEQLKKSYTDEMVKE
jgi:ribosomal protein S14